MIPRITSGRSATGALRYDHGPGRANDHESPHKVAGNVPGRTWRERAARIDAHAATRSDVGKPIHRTALRIAPGDRPLSDREWGQVATRYVEQMGFESCPWETTRHAGDHIHITVCRVQWDGSLAATSHDYARAQQVARVIEAEHGLIDASRRYDRDRPQVHRLSEGAAAARAGTQPVKVQLREHIDAAVREAGGHRPTFEAALERRGVQAVANIATTGRVSGYRYALAGHVDAAGEQVWHKGSQLGKTYGWARTAEQLREHAQPQPERAASQQPAAPEVAAQPAPDEEARAGLARRLAQVDAWEAGELVAAEQRHQLAQDRAEAAARAAHAALPIWKRALRAPEVPTAPRSPREEPAAIRAKADRQRATVRLAHSLEIKKQEREVEDQAKITEIQALHAAAFPHPPRAAGIPSTKADTGKADEVPRVVRGRQRDEGERKRGRGFSR